MLEIARKISSNAPREIRASKPRPKMKLVSFSTGSYRKTAGIEKTKVPKNHNPAIRPGF